MMDSSARKSGLTTGPNGLQTLSQPLAAEVPVALVYNGTTLAVMMASPDHLRDFAIGFSLTEGIIDDAAELSDLNIQHHPKGIEVQMWLPDAKAMMLDDRRRALAGPVGCGLCGIDSLDAAMRDLPQVRDTTALREADIHQAMDQLRQHQPLHDETHAAHAAGFYRPSDGMMLVREDVGRHNALDKLAGALANAGVAASSGAIVVTSRLSSEMIQKTAQIGTPILIAVSAPTALGVDLAEATGITLVTRARGMDFDMFTHPHRIKAGGPQ